MQPSWEAIGAWAVIIPSILTGAIAYGRLRQRVIDMGKQVSSNEGRLEKAEEKAADGEGDRRAIMEKLKNLADGQKEIRDLLFQHITRKDD